MRALYLVCCAAGCAPVAAIPTPPPRTTEARLVEGGCGAAGVPEHGQRVRAALAVEHGEMWLLVDEERVYLTGDRCVALDLPDGDHTVVVRARAEGGAGGVGVGVALSTVKASGAERHAFSLHCGGPGSCDRGTLRAWSSRPIEADACASARASGVSWKSGATSDGVHPEDIEVSFRLRTGAGVGDSGCP